MKDFGFLTGGVKLGAGGRWSLAARRRCVPRERLVTPERVTGPGPAFDLALCPLPCSRSSVGAIDHIGSTRVRTVPRADPRRQLDRVATFRAQWSPVADTESAQRDLDRRVQLASPWSCALERARVRRARRMGRPRSAPAAAWLAGAARADRDSTVVRRAAVVVGVVCWPFRPSPTPTARHTARTVRRVVRPDTLEPLPRNALLLTWNTQRTFALLAAQAMRRPSAGRRGRYRSGDRAALVPGGQLGVSPRHQDVARAQGELVPRDGRSRRSNEGDAAGLPRHQCRVLCATSSASVSSGSSPSSHPARAKPAPDLARWRAINARLDRPALSNEPARSALAEPRQPHRLRVRARRPRRLPLLHRDTRGRRPSATSLLRSDPTNDVAAEVTSELGVTEVAQAPGGRTPSHYDAAADGRAG